MKKAFLAFFSLYFVYLSAALDDYLYPDKNPSYSNYGATGLIHMPNGRLHEAGNLGLIYADFDPYKRISFIAAPFDWLEVSYEYTDIATRLYSDNFAFSRNQTLKDKGFDAKIRLFKETKFLPNLAVGFRDLAGTGLFSSEYLVMSKYYKNIDYTLGFGWGAINQNGFKNPLGSISSSFEIRDAENDQGRGGLLSSSNYFSGKNIGLFGGIEYFFPNLNGLRAKIELDSTDYQNEADNNLAQDSNVNFGFTYPISNQIKVSLAYIRGNTFNLNFSINGLYGNKDPLFSKSEKRKKILRKKEIKTVATRDKKYLYLATLKYLDEEKLYVRSANINEDKLSVSFAQNTHLSYPRAYGRAVRTLNDITPDYIKDFELISVNADFELSKITVNREKYLNLQTSNNFALLDRSNIYDHSFEERDMHEFRPKTELPAYFLQIEPSLQSHIGGPDRFYVGGLHVLGDLQALFTDNISLTAMARYGLADSFGVLKQGSDSVLPSVRTDITRYLKEGNYFSVTRFQIDYLKALSPNIYTRLSGGIFEEMFGGFGGEILYRPFHSNWAVGVEAYRVKQRYYDQKFKFLDYATNTGHATVYFVEPRTQILAKLIGGKYLAGDSGFTFDLSRRFKSGLRMGAFFSLTDISQEEFGEGSFDKGFYIYFPLEMFFKNYSTDLSSFGLRPVTRDGAAKLIIGSDLYGITDQGSIEGIKRDIDDYYE